MAQQAAAATHRVLGEHGADARELADVPQEPQEAHGAKPLQVVQDLGGVGEGCLLSV